MPIFTFCSFQLILLLFKQTVYISSKCIETMNSKVFIAS